MWSAHAQLLHVAHLFLDVLFLALPQKKHLPLVAVLWAAWDGRSCASSSIFNNIFPLVLISRSITSKLTRCSICGLTIANSSYFMKSIRFTKFCLICRGPVHLLLSRSKCEKIELEAIGVSFLRCRTACTSCPECLLHILFDCM